MTQTGSGGVGVARVEVEVTVGAPRERVWRALVEETSQWWPKDFYVGRAPKGFVIEARPGGRVYEDWGNEAGALWYTVLVVEPLEVLELAGHLTPGFGGPATTTVRLTLRDEGGKTVVKVEDSVFGRVDEHTVPRLREGWRTLMGGGGLKAWVEANLSTPA
ncbi:SRPBCC domain-containing protein [Archangium minus]|uniref:SRPBCC domain-containing protein n=2 Tax=Archangium minus TaxID=83450 RepID=A0ABY9X7K3_9BACT|nr:SRPBCC domain-containing protein [Archangium minus]